MQQVWLGVKDLQVRFGGLIGRDKIIKLMKEQHIRTQWIGRALACTEADIEDFEARILEADKPIEFKDSAGEVILTVVPQGYIRGSRT